MVLDWLKRGMRSEKNEVPWIEEELLKPTTISQLIKNISDDNFYEQMGEIIFNIEPGTSISMEDKDKVPNLIAEFVHDSKLAMIHGRGRGHALIRKTFLKEVAETFPEEIYDYKSLVRAFTKKDMHVKRALYIQFIQFEHIR